MPSKAYAGRAGGPLCFSSASIAFPGRNFDYDVAWSRVIEGGGMFLGDDVDIDIVIAASAAQTT